MKFASRLYSVESRPSKISVCTTSSVFAAGFFAGGFFDYSAAWASSLCFLGVIYSKASTMISSMLKILIFGGPPYVSWIYLATVFLPANALPRMANFSTKSVGTLGLSSRSFVEFFLKWRICNSSRRAPRSGLLWRIVLLHSIPRKLFSIWSLHSAGFMAARSNCPVPHKNW